MSACLCGKACGRSGLYGLWVALLLAGAVYRFFQVSGQYRDQAAQDGREAAEHRDQAREARARTEWDAGAAAAAAEHERAAGVCDKCREQNETWGWALALCKVLPWFVIFALAPWVIQRLVRRTTEPAGGGAAPDGRPD